MHNLKYIFVILISCLVISGCAVEPDEIEKVNREGSGCIPMKDYFNLDAEDAEGNAVAGPDFKKITLNDGGVEKGIMLWITDKIRTVMDSAVSLIYVEISEDDDFRMVLATLMTLSIMFYALAIMMGIAQASGYSMVMFILKLTFIYNFAVEFDIFKEYVIDTIEAGIADIIRSTEGIFHDYKIFRPGGDPDAGQTNAMLFNEIDNLLSYLWDFKMMTIILTLVPTGVTGFFWAIMLFGLILLYTFAIILAVKTFLLALIARFVLYALAPIFISLALFNQTKSLFDGYAEQLINFALQPIFLFIFLGMFHMILAGFINSLYIDGLAQSDRSTDGETGDGFCIQWKQVLTVGEKPLYWPSLCKQSGKGENASCYTMKKSTKPMIPIDLWGLISCIIICYLMYSMLHWVVEVAAKLSSGLVTVSDTPIQGFDRVGDAVKQQGSNVWQGARNALAGRS